MNMYQVDYGSGIYHWVVASSKDEALQMIFKEYADEWDFLTWEKVQDSIESVTIVENHGQNLNEFKAPEIWGGSEY
ncbi:hypothetical protein IC620_16110 [Hazenella sp. IB182357]|uniref:Uncharacterized protein n=1 Tax=Polycladospora coralii TaxID=2771432 RepID=A0A926NHX5_9BACL|nr:hypothetical protein [Polycladospora coralii]MBD1373869.1 hypothetical protein [Polycladospora coralii]